MDERICQIALGFVEGIGPVFARKLYNKLESARAIFEETPEAIKKLKIVPDGVLSKLAKRRALELAENELELMGKHCVDNLFFSDSQYPHRLEFCPDAPINLFIRGNCDLNSKRCISIVGTRHATSYGVDHVERFMSKLEPSGHTIVSGLAFGVDISAHRNANSQGIDNVAVLAHGLDRIYPAQHRKEALRTLENGAWVSEFPIGTTPDRENFPMRNRIVAGMCDLLIVVESASKGGSLITAHLAHAYNREIAAFPGKTTDKYSAGCNELIRTQKAILVQGIEDIQKYTGWNMVRGQQPAQRSLFPDLSANEKHIVKILTQTREMAIDALCIQSKIPVQQLSVLLLELEFKNIVKSMPGKRYCLI